VSSEQPPLNPEALLKQLVCQLTDRPEEVRIDTAITEHSAVFDIHVAATDVGKVLGRGGAHAQALRTLFNAIYGKYDKRLLLQVIDPRR
jgi:hypothetical protein